jgi:tetratricopeptide (TPR) repeat protein
LQEPVDLVERILDQTGWSQTRLVHELRKTARLLQEPEPAGLQLVTVNRWKQGRQAPSGYYRRLLRLLYQRCGQHVPGGPLPRGTATRSQEWIDDGDDMRRRRFFAYAAALAGTAVLDPERLSAALQRGIATDVRLLDDLAASIGNHARRWYVEQPTMLLPAVRDELATVNELRIGCHVPAIRQRLDRLATESATLAGWLASLAGNREAAAAYYTFSHGMASEAGDRDARAFVLVGRSFLDSRLFQPEVARERLSMALLDEAVSLTERSTRPFLRIFALTRHAEELATAGDPGSARASVSLDRAEAILASAGTDDGFFSYWNQDRLRGCRGTCAMLQGRPREATSLLSATLAATPADLAAERAILLADLGAAHAMQGEVEEACDLLARTLSVEPAGDAFRYGRVMAIRDAHLSRWPDAPAVRQLDESLRAAQAGPGP